MNRKVRTVVRILLFTGTAISLFFVPWPILLAWLQPLPDTVQEQVDDTLGYGFGGVIVYVGQSGKPPEFYVSGFHDSEKQTPARPQALFKIASISKLYVAVAITKLAKEGQLSLDDTLDDFFPELAGKIENAEDITVRLMVQHRSGIPNFTDIPEFWSNPPDSREGVLDLVAGVPATFEPGEGYAYSNTGYLLLQMLIESVTGKHHQQYIKEEILVPLGLNRTFASVNDVNIDDVMSGYYVGIDEDFKSEDAGMVATAEDVGLFLRALNDGSAFAEGEQEIYSSIYVYEHTGLIPGYQSIARYYEDIDTVVVQFTNTTDFQGYNWSLSETGFNRAVKILKAR